MISKLLSLTIICMTVCTAAFGHEYWFEPGSFFLSVGEETPVHLYVGDGLVKDREERIYQPEKTVAFDLLFLASTVDLTKTAIAGAMPVYTFPGGKAGNQLLAMERNWAYIKIDSQKFEDYLRDEGMDYIVTERQKLGEMQKEGRERYSRFIKSLLQVGDIHDNTFKNKLGWKLEIVPLDNPYSKRIAGRVRFQIFFDDKPLTNRAVFADNRDATTQTMETDKNGIVTMTITHSGLWLIRLVNMQRCRSDCGQADWESFWAAYTFGSRQPAKSPFH